MRLRRRRYRLLEQAVSLIFPSDFSFQRLNLDGATWSELVRDFGKLFYHVAGQPEVVEKAKTQKTGRRFHLRAKAREVLSAT